MITTADVEFQEKLKRWANRFAVGIVLISVLVLAGWQFDITCLIHPLPKLPPMNPVTAVVFIFFSLSFFLLKHENNSWAAKNAGKLLVSIIIFIGLSRIADYVLHANSNLDALLYPVKIYTECTNPLYARMSPIAAVCFVCAALALLMLNHETRKKRVPAHYLSIFVALIGLTGFMTYIYAIKPFDGSLTYVTMAIHTAICFVFMALVILFAAPDKGLMKELTNSFAGSIVARRLIPMAVLIPVVLGSLRLFLELNSIVKDELVITILIMCVIISLLAFIFYTTRLLNKRDLESKETEEELTETNYFLNTLLENIPDMIFVKDVEELRFFRFNKAGEELLGYTRNELIGKNDYDLFPKEQADFFTMKDRDVLKSCAMLNIAEEPIMTKNGERWLHTKKIPVCDENGTPLYLVGISEDITERRKVDEQLRKLNMELEGKVEERTAEIRKREARFRALIENSSDAVLMITEKSVPIYRSPSNERITGWAEDEVLSLESSIKMVHPDDEGIVKEAMEKVLQNSGNVVDLTFRIIHKGGHYIWIKTVFTNFLYDEVLKAIVLNFHDITESRKAQEEITTLTDELRQLLEHMQTSREEERKFIAREIHDELGQRLTALKIDVSMMRKKMAANPSLGYFTDELNSVINQIDHSIESVKKIATDLRPAILDHHGILAAVKWQAQQFENITGVSCRVSHLPNDINLKAEISTAVYRTVQEALTNIARHAQANSVNILIEQDSEKLLIEIKDNGKGIHEEQIKSMKSLGLIGIRERVHLLKGTLFITGKPGKGTVVSVNIPV